MPMDVEDPPTNETITSDLEMSSSPRLLEEDSSTALKARIENAEQPLRISRSPFPVDVKDNKSKSSLHNNTENTEGSAETPSQDASGTRSDTTNLTSEGEEGVPKVEVEEPAQKSSKEPVTTSQKEDTHSRSSGEVSKKPESASAEEALPSSQVACAVCCE